MARLKKKVSSAESNGRGDLDFSSGSVVECRGAEDFTWEPFSPDDGADATVQAALESSPGSDSEQSLRGLFASVLGHAALLALVFSSARAHVHGTW